MLIKSTRPTGALVQWLSAAHDDGAPPLAVEAVGPDLRVTRQDGSEPSDTERLEVTALLAAHAVAPLPNMP